MIGIDVVEIKRIEDLCKSKSFVNKVLTKKEQEYVEKKCDQNHISKFATIAGIFSAKESVLKAFGVGLTNGYGLKDVEIDHTSLGAPVVILSKKLSNLLEKTQKKAVYVSISHDFGIAISIAKID